MPPSGIVSLLSPINCTPQGRFIGKYVRRWQVSLPPTNLPPAYAWALRDPLSIFEAAHKAARMALALTGPAAMDASMTKVQATTQAITVKAEAFYVPERSSALKNHYFFAYRIEIENEGEVPVRLMNRHWVITDGHGEVQEVQGAGVIGSQPLIAPGDKFAYTSACPLTTPVGTMSGSYEMEVEGGEPFEAEIPAFTLAMPYSLN